MNCPLCNEEVKSTYGLSRFDNSTNICSECSTKEAYFLWFNSDYFDGLPKNKMNWSQWQSVIGNMEAKLNGEEKED